MTIRVGGDGGIISTGVYIPAPPTPPKEIEPASIVGGVSSISSENPAPVQRNASYDVSIQGNQIKPGAAIPCQYGRHIAYPDLVAQKITEVTPGEIISYYLLCLGQGSYDIENIKIGSSSLIDDVPGVTYEVIPPGGTVTLFPTVVYRGSDVALRIPVSGTGDIITPPGKSISKVFFDIQFPEGLYKSNISGGVESVSVTLSFGYIEIDANDDPVGGAVLLGTKTYTSASASPINDTVEYSVAEGRYMVVVQRLLAESADAQVRDTAYLSRTRSQSNSGHGDYGDITLIAIKTVSQAEAFNLDGNKISVVSTRKIQTWNGSVWSAAVASRSIMWAIADVIKAQYSAELTDEYMDLSEMKVLDDELTARGDYFDARLDDPDGVFDVIQRIASAGRCTAFLHDGLLRLVRKKQAVAYDYLFTPSNIVEGSFSISYTPPSFRQPDSLHVEYIDDVDWKTKSVDCNFGTNTNEQTTSFFGVTSREQAFREGIFTLAESLYGRIRISWETGAEGGMRSIGDVVVIGHDVDQFAQWGIIFNTIGVDKIVLSNPVNFNAQSIGYLLISTISGGVTAALEVGEGASPYELILAAGIPADISTISADAEPSRYVFVTAVSSARRVRITSIQPTQDGYAIDGVVEDDRVHTADEATVPAEPNQNWDISIGAAASGSVASDVDAGYSIASTVSVTKRTEIDTTYTASWAAAGYKRFKVVWSYTYSGENLTLETETTYTFDVQNAGKLLLTNETVTITPYSDTGVLLSSLAVTSIHADMVVDYSDRTIVDLRRV